MYTDNRPNRMHRVLRDIERDAVLLPEQRWPHVSSRAPRRPYAPPVAAPPDSAFRTTLATELRRASLEDERELREAMRQQQELEDGERMRRQKAKDAEIAAVRALQHLCTHAPRKANTAIPPSPLVQVLKHTYAKQEEEARKRRQNVLSTFKERHENWERLKKDIEDRVSKRPYLFEQASADTQVDRARQERMEQFEQTLRDNGLGDLVD